MRDEIFKLEHEKQFEFDERVVSVFDDMIGRSVPFYGASLDLILQILIKNLPKNGKVVDLGSSTGTLLISLAKLREDLLLLGIDNSSSMIESAKNKALGYGVEVEFCLDDILKAKFEKFDAAVLNYTLQFIRPILREGFVKKIYQNLNKKGIFILSEKLVFDDKKYSKDMIEIYEDYKSKQGYSKIEISRKRQALENVLIPYTENENITLCKNAGFDRVETLFKWGNFATFVAFKE